MGGGRKQPIRPKGQEKGTMVSDFITEYLRLNDEELREACRNSLSIN